MQYGSVCSEQPTWRLGSAEKSLPLSYQERHWLVRSSWPKKSVAALKISKFSTALQVLAETSPLVLASHQQCLGVKSPIRRYWRPLMWRSMKQNRQETIGSLLHMYSIDNGYI